MPLASAHPLCDQPLSRADDCLHRQVGRRSFSASDPERRLHPPVDLVDRAPALLQRAAPAGQRVANQKPRLHGPRFGVFDQLAYDYV